jgi:protein TonB
MTPEATSKNSTNAGNGELASNQAEHFDDVISSSHKNQRIKLKASDLDDLINIKKSKKDSSRKLKSLLVNISLSISLLLVIGAFEWKSYDNGSVVDLTYTGQKFEEIAEIPLTEQPPPPPPASQTVQIVFKEVPDEEIIEEIKVDLDVEITTEMSITNQVAAFEYEPEEEVAEEIFTIVEHQPEPKGGYSAFYAHIGKNLYYPIAARKSGVEGKVFIQFVVEPDGQISNVEVAKGIGMGCDEAAVAALKSAPRWKPGKQRGTPVRVRMIIPIIFKIAK